MAYNNKSKLPDTPWHIGFARKDENDPRRHKSRCIHLDDDVCKCGLSGCYMMHCAGSSHCRYYAEYQSQWDCFLEDMKTEEERNEEAAEVRAALYRKEKRDFVQTQLQLCTYNKQYRFYPTMRKCPFCNGFMQNLICDFCLAKFKVVKQITEEEMIEAGKIGYFLIEKL